MITHTDHAVRLPEDLAINILNAAATFSFDMIEAVDGYYRRHLMVAVEQGNVSRQKEILKELLRALSNHAGSRHGQAARDKDVIEQITAIESGLVSGDPTEWTMARAEASPKTKVDIAEVLKAGKEKMLEEIEVEELTEVYVPSPEVWKEKFEEITAEKKAAGDARKALFSLQQVLFTNGSNPMLAIAIENMDGALLDHIHELQNLLSLIDDDPFEDIDL